MNYRFIPKCAWPACIIDFVVFRPFEHRLATALQLQDVGDRFLSRLLPGLMSPATSGDITIALRRDTKRFLGSAIGLKDWRHITVAFSEAHKDPDAVKIRRVDPDNQLRGHTNETAITHYGNTSEDPGGVGFSALKQQLQAAHWWFDLVGMLVFYYQSQTIMAIFRRHPKR